MMDKVLAGSGRWIQQWALENIEEGNYYRLPLATGEERKKDRLMKCEKKYPHFGLFATSMGIHVCYKWHELGTLLRGRKSEK